MKTKTFIFILLFFLCSTAIRGEELYLYTTPDDQFNILADDKEILQEVSFVVQKLREELLEKLGIFYLWDKPAEIIIYDKKKWEKDLSYYFYLKKSKKENLKGVQTFRQTHLMEEVIFPAVTSLILADIISMENETISIEQKNLKLPLCLVSGLWNYVGHFEDLIEIEKISSLEFQEIINIESYPADKNLFYKKSAGLIAFLLNLPYGRVRLRKLFFRFQQNKNSSFEDLLFAHYQDLFEDKKAFNQKWREFMEASILAIEYEKQIRRKVYEKIN